MMLCIYNILVSWNVEISIWKFKTMILALIEFQSAKNMIISFQIHFFHLKKQFVQNLNSFSGK